jgi:hypothetical protein
MHPYPTNAPPSTGLLSTTLSLYKNQGLPDHEPEIELFPSYVRTSACARTHTISWRRDREMKGGDGKAAAVVLLTMLILLVLSASVHTVVAARRGQGAEGTSYPRRTAAACHALQLHVRC